MRKTKSVEKVQLGARITKNLDKQMRMFAKKRKIKLCHLIENLVKLYIAQES